MAGGSNRAGTRSQYASAIQEAGGSRGSCRRLAAVAALVLRSAGAIRAAGGGSRRHPWPCRPPVDLVAIYGKGAEGWRLFHIRKASKVQKNGY